MLREHVTTEMHRHYLIQFLVRNWKTGQTWKTDLKLSVKSLCNDSLTWGWDANEGIVLSLVAFLPIISWVLRGYKVSQGNEGYCQYRQHWWNTVFGLVTKQSLSSFTHLTNLQKNCMKLDSKKFVTTN